MSLQKRTNTATGRERSAPRQKGKMKTFSQAPHSFTSRLETFHQVHMINDEPVSYQATAPESLAPPELSSSNHISASLERLVTRSEAHNRSRNQITLQSPQWLAQVGFYYTPLSIKHQYAITCASCNHVIRDPIPLAVDISTYHFAENSSCALSAVWTFRNIISEASKSNDRSWQEDAVFGNVTSEKGIQIRRDTFKWWKHQFPDVERMVSTGLYCDPYTDQTDENGNLLGDDRVICMYCGLRLEQWEDDDDPVSVHQKEMPSCWVFNFDRTPLEDEAPSDPNPERLMIEHEHANEELPEFGNIDDFQDERNGIEIISSDKEDAPTIISLTTTTTTTTNTALPVEILDQDEVEEFLSNSQEQQKDENNKQVEIPSMKSSDLSQFFTELDAESESEVGASFFASNRRRREREKEQKEKARGNVEPIAEESIVSAERGEVSSETGQQKGTGEEEQNKGFNTERLEKEGNGFSQDNIVDEQEPEKDAPFDSEPPVFENEDFAFDNMDAFDHDSALHHVEDDLIETEAVLSTEKSPTEQSPTRIHNDGVKSTDEFVNQIVEKEDGKVDEKGISEQILTEPPASKELTSDLRKLENSRVEQLESELKLLKMQIEALQNTQNLQLQPDKEHVPTASGNDTIHDTYDSNENGTVTPHQSPTNDLQAKSQPSIVVAENVLTLPALTEGKSSDTMPFEEGGEENAATFVKEEDTREEMRLNVSEKLKKRKKEKKTKAKHLKAAGEEGEESREIDKNDRNGEKGKKKAQEKETNVKEITKIAASNDPLAFKLESKKRGKKHDKTRKKRQKIVNPSQIEVKQEHSIDLIHHSLESTRNEVQVKTEQTPEIPTEADQFTETSSVVHNKDDVQAELLVSNAILTYSEPNERLTSNLDEDKHEVSPTLMRKKARTPPLTGAMEEVQNSEYQTLDALMNSRKIESKEKATTSEKDEQFFLESEIMMKNQSTPYTANTKPMNMTEVQTKDATDGNIDCRRQLSLDEKREVVKWAPIESSKYQEFYKEIREATGYVKEVLDSKYELLGDDLEGLLTEFIAEIPPEQLKMTVREWIRFQEEQAVGLVLDKAEEMVAQFRKDQSTAIQFLERLPEKNL